MEESIAAIKSATKIPITTAGNISTSGSYILANDIAGRIQILVSNVSLDLNGHTITATSQDALLILGSSNIRVYNGLIVQSGTGFNCIKIESPSVRNALLHNRLRSCSTNGIVDTIAASKTLIYGNDVQDCTDTSTSSRPYHYESADYVYGNFAQNNANMPTAADNYSPQIKLNMAGTITNVTGQYANIALL